MSAPTEPKGLGLMEMPRSMCSGHVVRWASSGPELWALELYNTATPNTKAPLTPDWAPAVWLVLAPMTLSFVESDNSDTESDAHRPWISLPRPEAPWPHGAAPSGVDARGDQGHAVRASRERHVADFLGVLGARNPRADRGAGLGAAQPRAPKTQ